jgi:hypothetical protein
LVLFSRNARMPSRTEAWSSTIRMRGPGVITELAESSVLVYSTKYGESCMGLVPAPPQKQFDLRFTI